LCVELTDIGAIDGFLRKTFTLDCREVGGKRKAGEPKNPSNEDEKKKAKENDIILKGTDKKDADISLCH